MFGYVRPEKPDLLIRDFTLYKAVHCGLCKAIGRRGGQIPRLAVSYDMTFLSLLLLALAPDSPGLGQESCVLNPLKKKPVMETHPVLDYAADLSCLLAYYSAKDDSRDEKPVRGRLIAALLSRAARRAGRNYPELDQQIQEKLAELNQREAGGKPLEAASSFGEILRALFRQGYECLGRQEQEDDLSLYLLEEAAGALGRWVYLMDALDDLEEDRKAGSHNPFSSLSTEEARQMASPLLIEAEETVDRHLALLSYERFGGLVYNIVVTGLPATRNRILKGERLPPL